MKQVFTIQTNTKPAESQELSMRIGERHFGFAVTTDGGSSLCQLGWFAGEEVDENLLQQIYLQEEALRGKFKKVQLCFDHPQSVLVPALHDKETDRALLLEAVHGVHSNGQIQSETVQGWQLNNIYVIPPRVREWIGEHFAEGEYKHGYTVGIRNVATTDFEGSLVVDVRNDDFSLVVSRGNRLLLTQTYSYSTPADVIYHLLNACQVYSFSQDTVRVSLSGLVDKESALYRELYQYFIHLKFREPSWRVPDGQGDSYPSHFFTTLNDLAQCAS